MHTDVAAAAAAGFEALPATPTHVVVSGHHRDQRAMVERLGLALERVMVGGVRWRYHRPLVVGDRLRGRAGWSATNWSGAAPGGRRCGGSRWRPRSSTPRG
ncbi:MaoC family dehydratase N-terminal domain-containing protein [Pseudonocardia sp. RS010]|uniref:FAS1-like dehydratase domain-containing protein n=1 Tax=Pseudonocardia sp. RS010 TaxID=3385979 RepID=UPI00399F089D